MIPAVLEHIHEHIVDNGWAAPMAVDLGLPGEAGVIAALSPALAQDPRGPGKLHARDVIGYDRSRLIADECDSIAHGDVDDFSRFELLGDVRTAGAVSTALDLMPPELRRRSGRMSADYFRYSAGSASAAHQDGFGDLVVIWTLARSGGGAESFLQTLNGRDVMRAPLPAGSVLVFRDEMFLHGVTPAGGTRDALIFITLKDGA